MPTQGEAVWRNEWVVKRFLEGVRGGIPYADDQLSVMLRVLSAGGRPIERFLDLGSGSGLLSIAILTQFPGARATLVDHSEPMMDAARDLLGEDTSRPRFVLGDLESPTWVARVADDAPYDAVVSGFAIHHLSDKRKRSLYAEILQLLAPGAFFVNVEHVASSTPWLEDLFDGAVVDSLADYQSQTGTGRGRAEVEHDYHQRPDKAANRLTAVERQVEWLRALGFEDADCFFKYFELAVFGGRRPQNIIDF